MTGIGSIDDLSINVPDAFDEERQAVLDQVPVIKQWTTTTGISWKRWFKSRKGSMTTTLSFNALNNDFRQYDDNANETGLFLSAVSQEQEVKLRYNYTYFLKNWTLSWGIAIQDVDYRSETVNLVDNFNFSNRIHFLRYGPYGQVSGKFFNEKLRLSGGLRTDGNSFTNSGNEFFRTLSPRMALSFTRMTLKNGRPPFLRDATTRSLLTRSLVFTIPAERPPTGMLHTSVVTT